MLTEITVHDAPFPGTRGSRVRWMLEELGVPYSLAPVDLSKGEHKRPEYLEKHPHGKVPAVSASLEDTQLVLIESAAICMHLADTHPQQNLAPAPGTHYRAFWYQWIVYAVASLDEALVPMLFHTALLPADERKAEPVEHGKKVWAAAAPFIARAVDGRQWLLADHFTAADVVLGYDLHLAQQMSLLAEHPPLAQYYARLAARPAFRKVFG
jgi:glutathione S-transferase